MRDYQPVEALGNYRASAVFMELRLDPVIEAPYASGSEDTPPCGDAEPGAAPEPARKEALRDA
jgi:hypothetical protein